MLRLPPGHRRGLGTGDYTFGYVTSWATRVDVDNPRQVVTATGQRVLSAVTPVLDRLTATPNNEGAATATAATTTSRVVTPPMAGPAVRLAEQQTHAAFTSPDRARLVAVNRRAAAFFRDRLPDPACTGLRDYLARRGLAHLRLPSGQLVGYAPAGWTALTEHRRGRGFGDQKLLAAGVAQRSRRGGLIDRFRDRLMLGLHDAHGDLVGCVGRAAPDTGRETPKYLITSATVLFDKGAVLLGLAEQQERLAAGAVLVEGPLDVLAVHTANHLANRTLNASPGWAAVAPCGTASTANHAALLGKHPAGRVVVAFDADHARSAAAARAYPVLAPHQLQLQAGTPPSGNDPADLVAALRDPHPRSPGCGQKMSAGRPPASPTSCTWTWARAPASSSTLPPPTSATWTGHRGPARSQFGSRPAPHHRLLHSSSRRFRAARFRWRRCPPRRGGGCRDDGAQAVCRRRLHLSRARSPPTTGSAGRVKTWPATTPPPTTHPGLDEIRHPQLGCVR